MRIRPFDTTQEADRVQLDIFKRMTPEERLRRGFELSALTRKLQATGVRMRHPEYSDTEVKFAVIRMNLGDDLFLKVYPAVAHIQS